MTAIFISHRSSDDTEAQALKNWLGQQGHEQLFLDFDPADGIPAGVDWEQRLYQELRRCQALLIVLTPAWLESKWCGNELAIAREKGKAVFVVRVKACPAAPVIPAIQEADLTLDRDAGLEKLARGLSEHGLDPRDAFDWKPGRPIYPGLAAFDVDDAAIFFGRSEESWQTIEALRRMRLQAPGSPKLLLITGASGSGKSSLMRAGVLARLRKEPASWIAARPFRRGGDALGALAEALAWAFPPDRRPTSLETITARLAGPEGAGQLLGLARELRLAHDRPEATLVLALDQAEELLVVERGEDAAKLLDLLRAALATVGNEILVIATIRSDRLGAWQQHASIKATADHGELPFEMLPLGPMPMERIGEIVRGPAAYEGLRIDDDLVDAIRADTGTPDALPLLAYTLQYLHHRFVADGRLTLAEHRSFGGLEGSVRSQADAAIPFETLSQEDRRALQEAFVPGLVRATAQGGFNRSRAVLATLPPRAEPYLRRLIDEARLLTTDSDPQGGVTVEVAHESLLRVWPALVRWIAEDAESLRRLETTQRAAQDWAQAGRGEDFLVHRDHRLSDAEALIAEPRFAARLDYPDRDYLAACRNAQNQREAARKEAQERELRAAQALAAEQKAKTRRTLAGLAVACVLAVIAASLGWWAFDRAGEATKQREEAERQKEAAQQQLGRANEALATGLWNDLDFADVDSLAPAERTALWTLAQDGGLVRAAFVNELSANAERMQRFARRPVVVSRALGLGWPSPAEAQQAFGRVQQSIAEGQLSALAPAAQLLAGKIAVEQTQAALAQTLEALAASTDPSELRTLAQVVQSLPMRLTAEQANAALTPILDQLGGTTEVSRQPLSWRPIEPLATAVQALAGKLTPEQAGDALSAVLAVLTIAGDHSPDQLRALAQAVQALPVPLTAAQARDAMAQVLKAIVGTSDSDQLEALMPAAQALVDKLSAEQASDALGSVFDAIEGPADRGQAQVLAATALALAGKLAPEHALTALGPVLEALEGTTKPDQFWVLTSAARGLTRTLSAEQVRTAAASTLMALARTPDFGRLRRLTQALAVQLTAEQVRDALAAIKDTIDGDQLRALAQAGEVLLGARTASQARDALGPALAAFKSTRNDDALWVLAQAVRIVAAQLTNTEARDALGPTLAAFKGTTDHHQLWVLAQTIEALALVVTNDQGHDAFGDLRGAIRYLASRDEVDELAAWAQAVQALADKLTAEQARDGVGWLLDEIGRTTDPDHLRVLGQAVQALARRLTVEQARTALATVLPRLAWAPTSDGAARWAGMLVALLPREKPESCVAGIVEALKYPPSAGPATDVLLEALPGIDPTAPGKEAGLTANLAWLTATYPAIDLDARPACPPPLSDQQDVACPDGGA